MQLTRALLARAMHELGVDLKAEMENEEMRNEEMCAAFGEAWLVG